MVKVNLSGEQEEGHESVHLHSLLRHPNISLHILVFRKQLLLHVGFLVSSVLNVEI